MPGLRPQEELCDPESTWANRDARVSALKERQRCDTCDSSEAEITNHK